MSTTNYNQWKTHDCWWAHHAVGCFCSKIADSRGTVERKITQCFRTMLNLPTWIELCWTWILCIFLLYIVLLQYFTVTRLQPVTWVLSHLLSIFTVTYLLSALTLTVRSQIILYLQLHNLLAGLSVSANIFPSLLLVWVNVQLMYPSPP